MKWPLKVQLLQPRALLAWHVFCSLAVPWKHALGQRKIGKDVPGIEERGAGSKHHLSSLRGGKKKQKKKPKENNLLLSAGLHITHTSLFLAVWFSHAETKIFNISKGKCAVSILQIWERNTQMSVWTPAPPISSWLCYPSGHCFPISLREGQILGTLQPHVLVIFTLAVKYRIMATINRPV